MCQPGALPLDPTRGPSAFWTPFPRLGGLAFGLGWVRVKGAVFMICLYVEVLFMKGAGADAVLELDKDCSKVVVIVDGREISLTREQEALIRAWASGPV